MLLLTLGFFNSIYESWGLVYSMIGSLFLTSIYSFFYFSSWVLTKGLRRKGLFLWSRRLDWMDFYFYPWDSSYLAFCWLFSVLISWFSKIGAVLTFAESKIFFFYEFTGVLGFTLLWLWGTLDKYLSTTHR